MSAGNQRVRLTKMLLKNSLLELSKTKKLSDITVTELCKKAGINRCTFYVYYQNHYDILKEMEEELLNKVEKGLAKNKKNQGTSLKENIEWFTNCLRENPDASKLIFTYNDIGSKFADRMFELSFASHKEVLRFINKFRGEEKELAYAFFTNGVYGAIKLWLLEDFEISAQTIGSLGVAISENLK